MQIEERGRGAGDVTVCGGDRLREPRSSRATWPCPSPRLPAGRPRPHPRPRRGRFSIQVRGPTRRPVGNPPRTSFSSLKEHPPTSWLLDPVKRSAARSTWQRCVSPRVQLQFPPLDSRGPTPASDCYHPFPPRPHPLLRALLGATSLFFASLG